MSVRAGVIGLGFGKQHLKAYHRLDGVNVAAVCDLDKEALADPLIEECGARTYGNVEKMLAEEELDVLSICTPPGIHKPLTILAAQRGVHVLCEKPMAPSIKDCDAMIQACEENDVKLMIGFKKRFASIYVELERLIRSEFGHPFSIFYRYVCYGLVDKDWLWLDGGPIVDNTAHAIDILRFLAGNVRRIYAEGDNFLSKDKDEIDTAVFTLRFENGCVGAVRAGCWAKGPLKKEHLVAYFPKATVEIEGPFDSPVNLRIFRDEQDTLEELSFEDEEGGIYGEIEHFVKCIREGMSPRVTGQDGRNALELCLAVKESVRTHRPVML